MQEKKMKSETRVIWSHSHSCISFTLPLSLPHLPSPPTHSPATLIPTLTHKSWVNAARCHCRETNEHLMINAGSAACRMISVTSSATLARSRPSLDREISLSLRDER